CTARSARDADRSAHSRSSALRHSRDRPELAPAPEPSPGALPTPVRRGSPQLPTGPPSLSSRENPARSPPEHTPVGLKGESDVRPLRRPTGSAGPLGPDLLRPRELGARTRAVAPEPAPEGVAGGDGPGQRVR